MARLSTLFLLQSLQGWSLSDKGHSHLHCSQSAWRVRVPMLPPRLPAVLPKTGRMLRAMASRRPLSSEVVQASAGLMISFTARALTCSAPVDVPWEAALPCPCCTRLVSR